MNRRVSKTVVALLALTLVLQAPAAFAAKRDQGTESWIGVSKIIHVVKKIVRNLAPSANDDDPYVPKPPRP
jgi:hypothetical protein